jgi:NADPH-dependent 2,4-dienoyl-CoA reductase/sulfur reductase-like enzyme
MILVIGGVAAGMSAASQAKRRRPGEHVVVVERGPHVSYGACGMPYLLGDATRSMDELVVISPERFRTERGIDVRVRHEAVAIDVAGRRAAVRSLATSEVYNLPFDTLVVATGASAVRPPIPGTDLHGVFLLRELTDGQAMNRFLLASRPRKAVIVGAGYIGMEVAEVLHERGLSVSIVERLPQVVPGFEPAIGQPVREALEARGISVDTGLAVDAIETVSGGLMVRTARKSLFADLVLLAAGVRPAVSLARDAGITIGATGAIATDDAMRTSAPHVFAAGDCAEARHIVSGAPAWIPLGTTANKQGRVAGANAAGADERFSGIAGTAAFRLFDVEVARTGLAATEARTLGRDVVSTISRHRSRGHAFPGGTKTTTILVAERGTGRLLGAEMIGEGAAKRIDVFAAALRAGLGVSEIEDFDLAYAPPFAPVYDPILVAASAARKALAEAP